ncbi:hypothetical protein [Pleionea sp. CnH1-48]|uniref:hypothetical protein n=1 Tax=Pleionea sp. CnH1-48 TaxID=2954494 RepID=UPI0020981026|nr:hypothetical protein [Pleionea sp. CnH1-48]MCO7225559.1 hypothetical protein [Pleionea sp. CnH1-48]
MTLGLIIIYSVIVLVSFRVNGWKATLLLVLLGLLIGAVDIGAAHYWGAKGQFIVILALIVGGFYLNRKEKSNSE